MKTRIIALTLLLTIAMTVIVSCESGDITATPSSDSGKVTTGKTSVNSTTTLAGDATTKPPSGNEQVTTTKKTGVNSSATLTGEVTTKPPSGTTTEKDIVNDSVTIVGDGETVKFLSSKHERYYDELTLAADEITNIIDESVFNRELYVETRLNIKIENEKLMSEKNTAVFEKAMAFFIAGEDAYDLVITSRAGGGNGDEIYYNLYDVENVDLSMPWYNQGWIDANPDDVVTSVCGDATLSLFRFTFVTMCNMSLLDLYGVTDIYSEVINKTWTIDRQHEIVSKIYEDANKNGVSDEGDIFGFVTNTCTAVDPYWSAFDQDIIAKNDEGIFEFVLDVEKAEIATNKINDLFHNNAGTLILAHLSGTDGEYLVAYEGFASDRYAFATTRLIAVEDKALVNMDNAYGILPMPMLDRDQEDYGSYFHDIHSLIGIMGTVKEDKVPLVGAVLELFSAYSYNSTRDVYIETALKGRYFSDEQSRVVLDMVLDSITVNAGDVYSDVVGFIFDYNRFFIESNTQSWDDFVRSRQKTIETKLAKLNAGEYK